MDADQAVETLHRIDPGFRDICDALFPGLEPREVADLVYKSEPSSSDVHVMSTTWRNGRGHTKGRGRRKIDNTVKETRFVSKAKDHSKAARNIGLATTGIGTGISAVSLPKHLKEIPHAMKSAKTGLPASQGAKSAVTAVRNFSKPVAGIENGPGAIKAGLNGLKTGVRRCPREPAHQCRSRPGCDRAAHRQSWW